jgi:hypothetical protein
MIARIIGVVALGLFALAGVQTFRLSQSDRDLTATQNKLAFQKLVVANLAARVVRSETARQAEREQCAADFAGEVARNKIEIAKASKAALARSQVTGICPRASTQAERLAALRANSGESK